MKRESRQQAGGFRVHLRVSRAPPQFRARSNPTIHSSNNPAPLCGFTLVEMLVVIAILGILMGLLVPVLARGKDKAIRLTDVNNLKQQTLAMHLYCSDNADGLPWPNWFAGDGPNRPGWLYTLDTSVTGPARFKVETGLFWKTLHERKLYMCPADRTNTLLFCKRAQQISSYVMNGAVNGYDRALAPLRLADFSPQAAVFWETDEEDPEYFNDGASRPNEGVSARHSLGAIYGAFGGSVAFIKFDDWYREAAETNRSRLWCYPNSGNGR